MDHWLCLPDISLIGDGGCVGSDEPYITIGVIVFFTFIVTIILYSNYKDKHEAKQKSRSVDKP